MPSRKRVLTINQNAVDRAEESAARAMMRAYRDARRELVDSILSWGNLPGDPTYSEVISLQRQIGIVSEIDRRMAQLGYQTGQMITGDLFDAGELAIEQLQRELRLLPADLALDTQTFAGVNTLMVETYVPVGVAQASEITTATAANLTRELRLGLLQGESLPDLTARLFARTGSSPWARGRRDAELFTRRAVITANNAAKDAAIAEVGDPELQKQAVAVIGERTTDTCLRVHGQIQDVGDPFVLTGTPKFADKMMHPSFHWNCRTSIAMYHPTFERSGLTTANMEKSAKAELKSRRS